LAPSVRKKCVAPDQLPIQTHRQYHTLSSSRPTLGVRPADFSSLPNSNKTLPQLDSISLTEEQIPDITRFAELLWADIQLLGCNFEAKRQLIDLLDKQVMLLVENGQKAAHVPCGLDKTFAKYVVKKESL
jgi:hypothetical protein